MELDANAASMREQMVRISLPGEQRTDVRPADGSSARSVRPHHPTHPALNPLTAEHKRCQRVVERRRLQDARGTVGPDGVSCRSGGGQQAAQHFKLTETHKAGTSATPPLQEAAYGQRPTTSRWY